MCERERKLNKAYQKFHPSINFARECTLQRHSKNQLNIKKKYMKHFYNREKKKMLLLSPRRLEKTTQKQNVEKQHVNVVFEYIRTWSVDVVCIYSIFVHVYTSICPTWTAAPFLALAFMYSRATIIRSLLFASTNIQQHTQCSWSVPLLKNCHCTPPPPLLLPLTDPTFSNGDRNLPR